LEFSSIKYLFYIAYIVLGYIKLLNSQERAYLVFPVLGVLDITTNALDVFVFTSNLELLLVNSILTIGLFFVFFTCLKIPGFSNKLLFYLYLTLFAYAISLFLWDLPAASIGLYSNYGFLNTIEYTYFGLMVSLIVLVLICKIAVSVFQKDNVPLTIYFIIFGIMIYFIGDLVKFGLGRFFIEDEVIHREFLTVLIPLRFYASKFFILMGLSWKG
jgi:hypothetical protein